MLFFSSCIRAQRSRRLAVLYIVCSVELTLSENSTARHHQQIANSTIQSNLVISECRACHFVSSLIINEKRTGEHTSPCFKPRGHKNTYVSSPPARTLDLTMVYILCNALAIFHFHRFLYSIFHNFSLLTVSKALRKSTKATKFPMLQQLFLNC